MGRAEGGGRSNHSGYDTRTRWSVDKSVRGGEVTASLSKVAVMPTSGKAPPGRFKLLKLADLKALPQPEWLIKDLFRAQSQVVLYGPSGHGKSFVALDMALSIATGRSWFGRQAKQGPVVYVVSEGGRGTHNRVVAWMEDRDVAD